MKRITKAIVLILSVAYPFLVYWGINNSMQTALLVLLSCLLVFRICLAKSHVERVLVLGLVLVMAFVIVAVNKEMGLKLYPVLINLTLLIVFTSSLFSAMPIVERLARIREPHLCERAIRYTRGVTLVWCVFFAINGAISLTTVLLGNDVVWLWYNGVIAYLLIAALFGIEWLFRRRLKAATVA